MKNDYDNDFYKKYGFASCFECDETFNNLDELAEHQEEHLIEERTLGGRNGRRGTLFAYCPFAEGRVGSNPTPRASFRMDNLFIIFFHLITIF